MVARQAHGGSNSGDAKVQSVTSQWAPPREPSLALSSLSGVPHCADHSGDNDCGYVSELAIWMQLSMSGMLCVSVCTGPNVCVFDGGSLVPVYVTLCVRC